MTPSLDDIPTKFCRAFTEAYFYCLQVNPWTMVDCNVKNNKESTQIIFFLLYARTHTLLYLSF